MFVHMNIFPLLDHHSKVPLYIQAEQLIRKLIRENKLKEGELFPAETDLAKRWGISRNTLRQAMSSLVDEGLLVQKRRSGTIVGNGDIAAKGKITTDLNSWFSFTHEMEDKSYPFRDLLNTVSVIKCYKEIADRFQIETGTRVVCLERVRSTTGSPMVYFKSFFHPHIGLTGAENYQQLPLYEMLKQEFSIVPVYSQEEIGVVNAAAEISKRLRITTGTPVLERKRLVLDEERQPLEFNVSYYRSDWFSYYIELKRSETDEHRK